MRITLGFVFAGLAAALALCAGCGGNGEDPSRQQARPIVTPVATEMPPSLEGTVAQHAYLVSGVPLLVQGHGVAVGLAGKGSREVPPEVRQRLTQQMLRHGIGSAREGTDMLTPNRMLDDLDTAVVAVGGVIPPGAPKGTRFDVIVSALQGTQTSSLDGGSVMGTDLMTYAVGGGRAVESRPLAVARGDVFVNPFVDPADPDQAVELREGRLLGGAVVENPSPLRLILIRPDHATAKNIRDRINERFPSMPAVANATSAGTVEITVPQRYREDYEHFFLLLTHVYVRRGPGTEEAKARELMADALRPDARLEDIALVWEAMGSQVVPMIQDLYASENRDAAYYAARAGARLGDRQAIDVLLYVARDTGSPYQLPAVAELGRARDIRALPVLKELLDSGNELLRVAAYEAMLKAGFTGGIERYDIDGRFELHVVPTQRDFVVYATQSGVPRIVLFGAGMTVRQPLYFVAPDELVTIAAQPGDSVLKVWRRVGVARTLSDVTQVPPDLALLVQALGKMPERSERDTATAPDPGRPRQPPYRNMGLTYSQVVRVLYLLTQQNAVQARFVLQPVPQAARIYESAAPIVPGSPAE